MAGDLPLAKRFRWRWLLVDAAYGIVDDGFELIFKSLDLPVAGIVYVGAEFDVLLFACIQAVLEILVAPDFLFELGERARGGLHPCCNAEFVVGIDLRVSVGTLMFEVSAERIDVFKRH